MKGNKLFFVLGLSLITTIVSCGGSSTSTNVNTSSNDSFVSDNLNSEVSSIGSSSMGNLSSDNQSSSSNSNSYLDSSSEINSEIDHTSNDIVPGTQTSSIDIVNFGGELETAFAEFYPVNNASGYNVYYKLSSEASWTQVDTELIRNYGDYYRVDILGLKQGSYKLKVSPIISGSEANSKAKIVDVNVNAHQREGYAFVNKPVANAFGAYNDDGTLRSGAQVIYVTKDNAKTITASINGTKQTGLQTIIDAMQKIQNPSDIINFRILGTIDVNDLDHYSSSAEGLQIKGKSAASNMNLTLEGVGKDATFTGFGMLIRNCANVEVRNLGFMNYMDDGISIDTDNKNLWIHNNDFFYGQTGSASDQAKGDGALDTKSSSHITHSYNHFWDTGKSNLQGMTSESAENCITYHHNWFDHSDSRHPRVRTCTVHVFNNYYDGNSKYGIGATMGSSIYSEGNYFRKCKYPMLISLQGSDIAGDGDGTFSGEEGGMIKAYDNIIQGAGKYTPYSANKTEFDAYDATTRDEQVPSSIKSKSGSNTYNNFDTKSDFYKYTYQSPSDAKDTTMKYAGRVQGGDFKWTFTVADDSSYDVNTGLKNAINAYKTELVSVGGNSIKGSTDIGEDEVIKMIDELPSSASLEYADEIKSVYETYLLFDKSKITNSSKIEKLYEDVIKLEIQHCKELIDLLDSSLTLENINNALNYYNSLNSNQQNELASYKQKLDNKVKEYELIAASEVIKLIDQLSNTNNLTLNDEAKVEEATNAYNALTNDQKSQVTNYQTLVAAQNKIKSLKDEKVANDFIAKVNALPTSTSSLKASDLSTIEALLNEYNTYSNDVQKLIDSSYINKLNEYKTYINNNLISESTVSLSLNDLEGNSGTTSNGFNYKTNGESGGYIKLKGAENYVTYNVTTSSIKMELVAKCLDSSEVKEFNVKISYTNGDSKTYTYQTESGKKDKTYNETYTGNISSISIYGIEGKNLGVLSLSLTYSK